MNRVVITGAGCVTPIGATPQALWQSLEAGRSGIAPLPDPQDPSLKFKRAGQIPNLDISALTNNQLQSAERCSHLALLAAKQAVAASQLTQHHPPDKIAILLGCSTNGRQAEEPEIAKVYTRDARVHPLTIARSMASNGASQVAIDHGITGPALTISTACASGAHAIGMAFHMIRSGMVTAALAGAHEAPLTKAFLRAWDSMRVVSPTSCRPFSADRDGMTLAEGACILSLETLASARARNAPILAEILGFGMATDAHHITQPRPEGPAQAIFAALKDAAATLQQTDQPGTLQSLLEQVAYINAHGTATHTNDAVEAAALHQVFGPRAPHIPLSGTKGFLGHSLGASSAIETLITALALHHRRLPFTLGTTAPDPPRNLDLIHDTPRDLPPEGPIVALTNALAFGGLNAILCLRSVPR
jgi:nodulation protein E